MKTNHGTAGGSSAKATTRPFFIHGNSGNMACAVNTACEQRFQGQSVNRFSLRGASQAEAAKVMSAIPSNAIVIDFTHETALKLLLETAQGKGFSLISGTSGLGPAHRTLMKRRAAHSAVLHIQNFSLGSMMVIEQIKMLARFTSGLSNWEGAVLDLHHRQKLDCPSATAKVWANAWTENGDSGSAPISALRLGDGISEHKFYLAGTGERIEIQHRLMTRAALISGVMAGVDFIYPHKDGLFSANDLLEEILAAGARNESREAAENGAIV